MGRPEPISVFAIERMIIRSSRRYMVLRDLLSDLTEAEQRQVKIELQREQQKLDRLILFRKHYVDATTRSAVTNTPRRAAFRDELVLAG